MVATLTTGSEGNLNAFQVSNKSFPDLLSKCLTHLVPWDAKGAFVTLVPVAQASKGTTVQRSAVGLWAWSWQVCFLCTCWCVKIRCGTRLLTCRCHDLLHPFTIYTHFLGPCVASHAACNLPQRCTDLPRAFAASGRRAHHRQAGMS